MLAAGHADAFVYWCFELPHFIGQLYLIWEKAPNCSPYGSEGCNFMMNYVQLYTHEGAFPWPPITVCVRGLALHCMKSSKFYFCLLLISITIHYCYLLIYEA